MGSPLGPALATIVLDVLEDRLLENCAPELKPLLYLECALDKNWLLKNVEKVQCFLDYIDKQHPNI